MASTSLSVRLREKMSLTRLSVWFHSIRLVQFAASVSFMAIIFRFLVTLPRGVDASFHTTPICALSIVSVAYPILVCALLLALGRFRSKSTYFRFSRAIDSFVAAPIFIAIAVLLGDAGLPSSCDSLYSLDDAAYDSAHGNGTAQALRSKVHGSCTSVRAGFGLVVLASVALYLTIAIASLYLYFLARDSASLPLHNIGSSCVSQIHSSSTEILLPPQAHIRPSEPDEPPPPPYTQNEILTPLSSLSRVTTTSSSRPTPLPTSAPLSSLTASSTVPQTAFTMLVHNTVP